MDMLFISHFFDERKLEINDNKNNTFLRVTKLCFSASPSVEGFNSYNYDRHKSFSLLPNQSFLFKISTKSLHICI